MLVLRTVLRPSLLLSPSLLEFWVHAVILGGDLSPFVVPINPTVVVPSRVTAVERLDHGLRRWLLWFVLDLLRRDYATLFWSHSITAVALL